MAHRVRTVRDLDEFTHAIGAIGHYFGRPEDEAALREALNDPEESVRSSVRSALAALRGEPPPVD